MSDGPVRILLVEDDPNDVRLTMHALSKHNLANEIVLARDGAEALEKIFGRDAGGGPTPNAPDIVLLDLKLPRVNGMEVLRRIKGDPRTRTIPVVVLTSSQEERDIVASYQLGVNSYIVKPVDFESFAQSMVTLGLYWLLLNRPPIRETERENDQA